MFFQPISISCCLKSYIDHINVLLTKIKVRIETNTDKPPLLAPFP